MINNEEKVKFRNTASIDIVKLIMAVVVVAVHTRPFVNIDNCIFLKVFDLITYLAVPFFFLSTGYLLGFKLFNASSATPSLHPLYNYLKKIVKLYITWTLVYFPLAIVGFFKNGTSLISACFQYLRGFLLIGENYNSWPLWYLLSVIYTLLLLIFLFKKNNNTRFIVILGFCAISVGFFIDWVTGTSQELPSVLLLLRKIVRITIINGRIFRGMFYIPFGILLSQRRLHPVFGIILFIVGFVIGYFLDGILLSYATLLCSIGLFTTIINIKIRSNPWLLCCRKISTDMYFLHMWIWSVYYMLIYGEKQFGFNCFLITTITCIVASLLIQWFSCPRHAKSVD